ncbi:MAG: bacteriorhodopsin-like [Crocinitomicaceae bacterium]|jgi:bacteriorhodopsin|nr:bacteriorhodopsin [Crocinitomicaceae bacterium]MDP4596772.1 bacteriorhodopsin-like [Crocinitomicaceae bacterium]MDP4724658.1 bacteriorhodopsin-like [Crocinitomicaceae bacterium]MDP4739748.1 bacteriorhodopsin-like [Crocinitomicaceae bacterium]MDP4798849.1 bacteriorhodopsin-like [Crocinitomicaceae bacterium]
MLFSLSNALNVQALFEKGDVYTYTAFTFFIGTMAMMAAAAFFFMEMRNMEEKWRTSILVSGLITFIAAVHYYYMRDYFTATSTSPTFFRYVDWMLTVPLMCVEFYLITKKAGAKTSLLWKLIFASVVMLVTGYFGESVDRDNSVMWGVLSGAAYFYIAYLVWFGEVAKLAESAGPAVAKATRILAWFVLVGWAIYPLGYIIGTPGGLFGAFGSAGPNPWMDVVYNIGDAVNKIGFGLVIYALAKSDSKA